MSATDTGGGTHGHEPGPGPAGAAELGPDLPADLASRRGRAAPRGRRRGPLLIGVAVAVAAVAAGGALGFDPGGDGEPTPAGRGGASVEVTRRTLVDQTAVDGTLGHGAEIPLPVKATGTVTWLPEQGDRIARGETVLRVDDRPVVLLYGALPMYRGLGPGDTAAPDATGSTATAGSGATATAGTDGTAASSGTSDAKGAGKGTGGSAGAPGPDTADAPQGTAGTGGTGSTGMDVRQFETNLAALGYSDFTVDDRYTAKTAAAVKRWQEDLGVPETGRIAVGDIVYTSGRITVGRVAVRVGGQASPEALGYTGGERRVTVEASAQDGAWAVRDARVTVELPGGEPVDGRVQSVSREMRSAEGEGTDGGGGGAAGEKDATSTVTIRLLDQSAIGRVESAPVTVRYVSERKAGVLAVPVAALVALAEGGHGLERAGGGFVAVRTGLFAEGMVEVSGRGVRAGMKVRVPE